MNTGLSVTLADLHMLQGSSLPLGKPYERVSTSICFHYLNYIYIYLFVCFFLKTLPNLKIGQAV